MRKPVSATLAVTALALVVSQAFAQEKKEEVPFWAVGRPTNEVAGKMAPVPALPVPTARVFTTTNRFSPEGRKKSIGADHS